MFSTQSLKVPSFVNLSQMKFSAIFVNLFLSGLIAYEAGPNWSILILTRLLRSWMCRDSLSKFCYFLAVWWTLNPPALASEETMSNLRARFIDQPSFTLSPQAVSPHSEAQSLTFSICSRSCALTTAVSIFSWNLWRYLTHSRFYFRRKPKTCT